MSRPEKPDPNRTGGFTLVEALAALTVMAVGLAGIGELAASSIRAGSRTTARLVQTETARSIWASLPERDALPYGRTTGSSQGLAWGLESAPVPPPVAAAGAAPSRWKPQAVTLVIRSPSGGVTEIQTIRLRRDTAK